MRILLDTHIFLWAITSDSRLSPAQRDLFLDDASDLFLSVASVWEMLIKTGLGRLPMPAPSTDYIVRQMEKNRIALLPIRVAHLAELETLPPLPRDPFDRMLVAQARAEKMPLLSADVLMEKSCRDLGTYSQPKRPNDGHARHQDGSTS